MSERPGQRVPYFEHDPEEGQPPSRVLLTTWPFRIGRGSEAELTIHSRRISTLHAELVRVPSGHVLRDLGSTNGTFVNGKKIREAWLKEGDVVHIAHKELRFGIAEIQDDTNEPTLAQHSEQQRMLRETNDLMRILEARGVAAVFQPIVRLSDASVMGFETLGRVAMPGLDYDVGEALRIANERGEAARLCRLFRDVAVEELGAVTEPRAIFFNLHPTEMDEDVELGLALEQMARVRGAGHQPVLEIHESAVTEGNAMARLRARLADLGIKLAYDDFGAGQSRLMELVEVPPEYLKLDITLVRDIDRSERRQDLVRALVPVLASQGVEVLAEGIERPEEAEVCRQLGCQLGQGYHFGRPAPI
ncbi:MAG: EAL domain-containing protein [Sandaracinaceae bacterium]|nr:EAL domain-containing protein [Sandaracinaceae bacterium]